MTLFRRAVGSRSGADGDVAPCRVETVRYAGRYYQIPVDADGTVPLWAMAARLQEVGDVESEMKRRSEIVLPTGLTPREVVESGWWLDPRVCDVEGVDTPGSPIYDTTGVPASKRHAMGRIAVVAPPEEARRIRREVCDAFTAEELEAMAKGRSVVARTVKDGDGAVGVYHRRQPGLEVPLITIEEGGTADPVVHEFTHHSRAVDPKRGGILKTPFPTDRSGKLSGRYLTLSEKRRNEIEMQEEAATIVETDVRTRVDPDSTGWYEDVPGMDPREAYIEDQRTTKNLPKDARVSDVPRYTGKRARDATVAAFSATNIARGLLASVSRKGRGR